MRFMYRLEITIKGNVFYTGYMDGARLEAFTGKFDKYITCIKSIRKEYYVKKVLP